jgi:hypothetical protein
MHESSIEFVTDLPLIFRPGGRIAPVGTMKLIDTTRPEKSVLARSLTDAREFLEQDFQTTYLSTELSRINFRADGAVEFEGHVMPYTPGFLETVTAKAGMPLGYSLDISPQLYRANFDERKHTETKAVTVCINRSMAVNLATDDFRPVRTTDLLATLIGDLTWKFKDARITDRGVDVNLIQPGRVIEPAPGDEIELGVRISNSETGFTCCKASLYSHRLVCSNGAVMADRVGTARWISDKRVAYSTSVDKFHTDLNKLLNRQTLQADLYDNRLQRPLFERQVVNLHRRMKGERIEMAAIDRMLGLLPEERSQMQARVRARMPGQPDVATALSLWDAHNNITAAAQRLDFHRRSRLEVLGGELLSDPALN